MCPGLAALDGRERNDRSKWAGESRLISSNLTGPLASVLTTHITHNSWGSVSTNRVSFSFSVLEVVAVDQGSSSLSTSVLLNIEIQDSNDNAPIFPEGNYTVYVQEDKPYGHILLRFSVTDSDDSPNGAPFTWWVVTTLQTLEVASCGRIINDLTVMSLFCPNTPLCEFSQAWDI